MSPLVQPQSGAEGLKDLSVSYTGLISEISGVPIPPPVKYSDNSTRHCMLNASNEYFFLYWTAWIRRNCSRIMQDVSSPTQFPSTISLSTKSIIFHYDNVTPNLRAITSVVPTH